MTRERDGSIARAAKAAGVALNFTDALGQRRDVPHDTVFAVLAAMGFDPASSDITRQISRRRRDVALAVVTEGKAWRIASASARDAGPATLVTERGEVIAAELSPARILSPRSMPGPGYHRL